MRYIYPARPKVQRRTHPLLVAAAVSVIFFSVAGAMAMLGYQPLARAAQSVTECSTSNSSEKIFDNSKLDDGNAINSTVTGSRGGFDSEMPSLGAESSKEDFDVLITKS